MKKEDENILPSFEFNVLMPNTKNVKLELLLVDFNIQKIHFLTLTHYLNQDEIDLENIDIKSKKQIEKRIKIIERNLKLLEEIINDEKELEKKQRKLKRKTFNK